MFTLTMAARPRKKDIKYVLVHMFVERTTELAVLLLKHDSQGFVKEFWVPRSVIRGGANVRMNDTGVSVADWFAEKYGLITKPEKPKGQINQLQ